MKQKSSEWDREKKLHRVEKGTDKATKHRNSIYNMLADDEDEFDDIYSEYSEVKRYYKPKQR